MQVRKWYTAAVGIEGHAEENVGRPLVKLAGEPPVGHVELEQAVAGRKRHLVDKRRVPGGDDVPARIWVRLDALDEPGHLVDMAAVIIRPRPPLRTVDRSEVAVLVGPFIPDTDAVFLEIGDIGITLQEPEQFVDDRLQVQPFRGDDRKAVGEVESHLMPEDRTRARARAIAAVAASLQNVTEEVVILVHGSIHRVVVVIIISPREA